MGFLMSQGNREEVRLLGEKRAHTLQQKLNEAGNKIGLFLLNTENISQAQGEKKSSFTQ